MPTYKSNPHKVHNPSSNSHTTLISSIKIRKLNLHLHTLDISESTPAEVSTSEHDIATVVPPPPSPVALGTVAPSPAVIVLVISGKAHPVHVVHFVRGGTGVAAYVDAVLVRLVGDLEVVILGEVLDSDAVVDGDLK